MYKAVFAVPARHPFRTSAICAAVLAFAAVAEFNSAELPDDVQSWNRTTILHEPTFNAAPDDAASMPHVVALADVIGRAREWLSDAPEHPIKVLSVASPALANEGVLSTATPEPPLVAVPEVKLVFSDGQSEPLRSPAPVAEEHAEPLQSRSATLLDPINRELFVRKGDEMLARGDVTGARLLFRRAAEAGDPRAAAGMASTFDPQVLRRLRVYGVRPDPAQAAQWYERSKVLSETVAVAR
jgi:hypothetical protein